MHANTADFEEEVINKISEPANEGGEGDGRVEAESDLEKVAKRATRPLTKYDLYLRASQKTSTSCL